VFAISNTTGTLECIDQAGTQFPFPYDLRLSERDDGKVQYTLMVGSVQEHGDRFELTACLEDDGFIRIQMMNAHGRAAFLKKRLPEAAFSLLARVTGKEVRSSSNKLKVETTESRNENAEWVWKSLCHRGIAIKNEERDYYVLKVVISAESVK